VSLDPEGAYVAASFADGGVGIWDAGSGAQEMRKHLAAKVGLGARGRRGRRMGARRAAAAAAAAAAASSRRQPARGTQGSRLAYGPPAAAPSQVDAASTRRSQLAWSPDGGILLAVAGRDQDVVLLERLSWCVPGRA
jgi:hypothetical protein